MPFLIGDAKSIGTFGWDSGLGDATSVSIGSFGWYYELGEDETTGEPIEFVLNQRNEIMARIPEISLLVKDRISFVLK